MKIHGNEIRFQAQPSHRGYGVSYIVGPAAVGAYLIDRKGRPLTATQAAVRKLKSAVYKANKST